MRQNAASCGNGLNNQYLASSALERILFFSISAILLRSLNSVMIFNDSINNNLSRMGSNPSQSGWYFGHAFGANFHFCEMIGYNPFVYMFDICSYKKVCVCVGGGGCRLVFPGSMTNYMSSCFISFIRIEQI